MRQSYPYKEKFDKWKTDLEKVNCIKLQLSGSKVYLFGL